MTIPEYASTNDLSEIQNIKIGDKVKSYDQEFEPFSWVVGNVVSLEKKDGCVRCVIEVEMVETCRDENGIHDHVVQTLVFPTPSTRPLVYPPMNGTMLIGGKNKYTNFIQKVD